MPEGICRRCLAPQTTESLCRACLLALAARWRRLAVESSKYDSYYNRLYGLSLVDYGARFVKQLGRCAICADEPEDYPLCVDHDHSDGRVRGLLCRQCNVALGMLKDNPVTIDAASDYLRKHQRSVANGQIGHKQSSRRQRARAGELGRVLSG